MMDAVLINVPPSFRVSKEQFEQLASVNRDVRLELTSNGELIIIPPTGGNTGKRNIDIEGQLWFWNRQTGLGVVFDSSTGFCLPNSAYRSPDAAWISKAQWDNLTIEQQDTFPLLCPDFIIELRSPSDTMKSLREKMLEYIDNGATLGWLIDPKHKKVEVYRGDRSSVEVLDNPKTISGEGIVSGFVLNLSIVFS